MKEITVQELKKMIDSGENFQLIDVREPEEHEECCIDCARLIPLGTLPDVVGDLDPNQRYIIHCKRGGRSASACEFLMRNGFADVTNVQGGIMAWMDEIV